MWLLFNVSDFTVIHISQHATAISDIKYMADGLIILAGRSLSFRSSD